MMSSDEKFREILCSSFFDEHLQKKITVDKDDIFEFAAFLKKNTDFDMLINLTGVDCIDHFEVVYEFLSLKSKKRLSLSVELSSENPRVLSISSIYCCADWYEREVFDLAGIVFDGHKNLSRILMPDGWIGYPLRKNYTVSDDRLRWNARR